MRETLGALMIAAIIAGGPRLHADRANDAQHRSLGEQSPAAQADAASPAIHIPKVAAPVSIDDFVNEPEKRPGLRLTGFRQREPGDGTPVSQDTSAYLFYDDTKLYVVFVCHDIPGLIRSRLAPREDIAEDDQVSIYLDTFHDRRHAYVFSANPRGVQEDGLITEGAET